MLLRDWRQLQGWTLARMAEALELVGRSPAETVRRWETGESRPEADIIARIEALTLGAVTASDMHVVRLVFIESRSAGMLEGMAAQ